MTASRRRRPSLRALVVVALASTGLVASAPTASAAPTLRWERDLPGSVFESSPLAVDLDGDGREEVLFGTRDSRIHAYRADGSVAPGWPQPVSHPVDSSVSATDVDGDGRPELFVGSGSYGATGGALYSFTHSGATRFRFVARDNDFAAPAIFSTPAIGDVRPDGNPDVSFASLGLQSIWSLDSGGRVNPGFPFYADDTVFSSPALADATGDGVPEVIIGGDSMLGAPVDHQGGLVRAITGDGRLVWEVRTNDIVRSSPSVGDIDGDGVAEVVFGAGDFYGGSDSERVFAVDVRNGRMKPGWPQLTNGVTNASPTLADLDGDGRLDVSIGTWESNHGRGRGASVYAWDGSGRALGGYPRGNAGGIVLGQIVTADLNSDGGQDLLVPTAGAIRAFSGKGGGLLFELAIGRDTAFQGSPVVSDLDGNGLLDIVAAGLVVPTGRGRVFRWELGREAVLGSLGWHQFRKDDRRTGSWTTAPTAVPRDVADACPPGRVPEDGFGDVAAGSTHEASVDCAVWWRVASGTGSGTYVPARAVTRDQMASFIARLIENTGGSLPTNAPDRFPDDDGVHEANIDRLAAAGIVSGLADGRYGAADLVTRGQMATFLVRAYEYRSGTRLPGGVSYFSDDAGSSHEANIDKAAAAGFTGGTPGGGYRPLGPVARDQMASFLVRVLDLAVERQLTRPPV